MLATFKKGGVHPKDKKYLTNSVPIKKIDTPSELVVAMSQHLGAPATLLKAVGDHVEKGERIGQSSSFISADVHSPVSGTITSIKKVTLANSAVCDAAVIKPDEVQPLKYQEFYDWENLSKEELLSMVKDFGIVGLGGATFPSHVKFTIPTDKKVETLVINGVECEPYLTSDHRVMLEKTKEVLKGILICAKILEPEKIKIGVERNKMDAVEALRKEIEANKYPIEVVPLKMKYPQGDEKQLLKATVNREIPSGKLPLDIGAVVVNIGSAFAVYNAIVRRQPLFKRVVTVSGECVKNPGNFLVPIGTKVKDLFEIAGGFTCEPDKLISGGPMMGFAFCDEETPVTKGTSGILAIKDEKNHNQTPCLSCGKCVSVCPIGLEPTKLYSLISNGKYEEAMKMNLMDCKECGCCTFTCPAHLELVQAFKIGKKLGRKK